MLYSHYIPHIILSFLVTIGIFMLYQNKLQIFIFKNWQLHPTTSKKVSILFFVMGLAFLFYSALDIKGDIHNKKEIEITKHQSYTTILIDISLSMATEDIYPNRFKRSIFLARHLVKSLIGNKISILLFSTQTTLLVPFTDDYNYIDIRLRALTKLQILRGGSNITSSIESANLYLNQYTSDGNIIVFSDGEELLKRHFPVHTHNENNIVHFVAMGTLRGGMIPIRNYNDSLLHYKRKNDQNIISKLNIDYIKNLQEKYDNYFYYMPVLSNIPTKEIISNIKEFKSNYYSKQRINSAKGINYILIGILFLIISNLLALKKGYIYTQSINVILLLLISMHSKNNLYAQTIPSSRDNLIKKIASGEYHLDDLFQIAQYFYKNKFYYKMSAAYLEILNSNTTLRNDSTILNNYAVSNALEKKYAIAWKNIQKANIYSSRKDLPTRLKIYSNTLLILNKIKTKNKTVFNSNTPQKSISLKKRSKDQEERKKTIGYDLQKKIQTKKIKETLNYIKNLDIRMQEVFLQKQNINSINGSGYDW